MVDRFQMAVYQATVHSRGHCRKARKFENPISQQCSVEEALENCRGSIQGSFFALMESARSAERLQENDVSFTYGCLDPVMVTQMAKYLDTVYVSGWQASSTASSTDEPGPDLADYPYVSPTRSREKCTALLTPPDYRSE